MEKEFPIVVLAGLTVFGLVFALSQSGGFDFGSQPREKVVLADHDFGKVGSSEADFRTVNFGDFTVGETRGDILVTRQRKADLKKSLFSGEKVRLEYNATQPRGGKVQFEVLGKKGDGAVYVSVNGERIFKERLVTTGTPNVTIPEGKLQPGMNDIVIGATQGGILSSTHYSIEDLEVTVDDRKFHDFTDTFQLYDYEISDFVEARLSFQVEPGAVKTSPLEVFVNGNKVYTLSRVRGSEEISLSPRNADLHPGLNTVKFSTDGDAEYSITNADMTVRYIGATERRTLRLEFPANSSALNFAEKEDTEEKIRFEYQRFLPSQHQMIIDFNGVRYRTVPENGENTVDISSEILEEDRNIVIIRSNSTYTLNGFKVVSEKVDN
ncbi:MAG: hypothetical protein ABEI58_02135 [Candidatus Nanohaloarchaea archaeon]